MKSPTIARAVAVCLLTCALWPTARKAHAQAAAAPPHVSFAVVIGNNQSLGNRRAELRYADDDAARYFEILQTMAPGRVSLLASFDRDTEKLFPSARPHTTSPSKRNLNAVGRRLADQVRAARAAGQEVDVYFIFAGHGDVAEGEGFIELLDARFRAADLTTWLRAIPFSRAHVILDSATPSSCWARASRADDTSRPPRTLRARSRRGCPTWAYSYPPAPMAKPSNGLKSSRASSVTWCARG
jgi:hypothetical protein